MGIGAPSLYAAFGDKRALAKEPTARAAVERRIAAGVAAGELPQGTDGASREQLEAVAEIALSIWPRTGTPTG